MILDPILDLFRGRAITIPPMDGALRPNTALEEAELVLQCDAPDNLVTGGGRILFSSGNRLVELPRRKSAEPKEIATFSSAITALAVAKNDLIAVGLDAGTIEVLGKDRRRKAIEGFNCPVAMAFDDADRLYVCNGSDKVKPSGWASDLMQKSAAGAVWQVPLAGGERQCLAGDLAFPFGVIADFANGRLIVSESWRHRLVGIPLGGGAPQPVLDKLPGYPARISPMPGGYLLSLFAPRNRLIEFVLLEDDYRAGMMREIDSRYWIAPSLSASRSFLEPLQNGGVKTMGIHKPWSPSRSYGLIVELDEGCRPVASYHSRANGTRHGITSAIAAKGRILAASKGGDAILGIATQTKQI